MVKTNFTLKELTRSTTATNLGMDNLPTPEHKANLGRLTRSLELIRTLLGDNPMIITSGYRSPQLNTVIGGSKTSMHCHGLAADFVCPRFGTPEEIVQKIANSDIEFDQLILEQVGGKEWVHFGLPKANYRRQVLRINDKGTQVLTVDKL